MRDEINSGLDSAPRNADLDNSPRDTRAEGRSRRPAAQGQQRPEWVARPELGTMLGLRFIVWVALTLGRRAARLLLYPVCLYFVIFSPALRDGSLLYLRKVLPREPGFADALRHCHTFAATLLDRVFLLNDQYARFKVHLHGEDILASLMARGEGCFLLGAHMGSFEIVRAAGGCSTAAGINLVMYQENARRLNSILRAINPGLRLQVIALGKIDSMLKVETALNRGEIVGMLGDRTFQGEGTVTCQFLGRPARFPIGPFRLAAMLKRPMVLMVGLYRGANRYDIYFERLVDTWQVPRAANDLVLEPALHRYVERLEYYCRDAPYNWFNFYDFWR